MSLRTEYSEVVITSNMTCECMAHVNAFDRASTTVNATEQENCEREHDCVYVRELDCVHV